MTHSVDSRKLGHHNNSKKLIKLFVSIGYERFTNKIWSIALTVDRSILCFNRLLKSTISLCKLNL